jgi:GNAT superfamily N-acetyltransferase
VTSLRILDITDDATFRRIPPCADPRFDHRTCDHWEDADRGSRSARPAWLSAPVAPPPPPRPAVADNPFAPPPKDPEWNPFSIAGAGGLGSDDESVDNPFAPARTVPRSAPSGMPRKLELLDRGRKVFGSYAKILLEDDDPVAYAQFGPLSAYPRASRIRELYPRLPVSPLPAVVTCIATTAEARGRGHAQRLVEAVCDDLAARGFAAVEAYPDLSQSEDATSAARPGFWERCGFTLVIDDPHFPVMRRELG